MHSFHHHAGSCSRDRGGFQLGFKPPFGIGPHVYFAVGRERVRTDDLRRAVLRLLSEEPMHGYKIIQEISERSGGAWSPSPGSVYPTLQLLADEGLVTSDETDGRKMFSLTEAGAAEVAEIADQPAPWDETTRSDAGFQGYRKEAGLLARAVWQAARTGSTEQLARAADVLAEARKQLHAIFVED